MNEDEKQVMSGIFDVIKAIVAIVILLAIAPAWPILIIMVVAGGIFGGQERFMK